MGLSSTNWFALIEFVYIGGAFWFCKKLLHENVALAMMFFFSSFSFFSYGTNTIRQGFAAGMLLVGFAYLTDKRNWWIGVVVFLFAFGVHRSMIIPIICMCISKWGLKSVKIATWIWGGSVIVSLVLGGYFAQYFADMNFDDRVAGYAGGEAGVYKTGFRFDFLIYSAMPIIASWYACVKKNIKDDVFNMLSVSYILANALWVQCIRIPYTDRFAYTSWFLYPFVLAYAFIRLRLSDNQDRLVGKILLIQACFTLFMYLKSS